MTDIIFDLADKLRTLKDEKKELEAKVKEITSEIEKVDSSLSDAMVEAECERFSRNGSTFYLNSSLYASPQAGKKDEMISALKGNGYGDIVVETVNSRTLSSFVREVLAENDGELPSWLSETINTYEKVSVGVRKG